jgi:alanine racemase
VIRSPKVQLTSRRTIVCNSDKWHNLGIFEAGISTVSEMAKLEIIKPTIGVLTSIGSSHDEGFESEQKIKENCFF